MKYQTLLKLFLLLALIFTFSSFAHASEVTGTLSSSGITSTQNTSGGGGGSTVTSGSGTLSGTVSGGISSGSDTVSASTSSGGGRGGEGIVGSTGSLGSVLGAETVATNSPNGSSFSTDGTAFGPSSSDIAQASGITTTSPSITSSLTPTGSPTEVAAALSGFGGFTFNSWFWIIFLLLLLVATMAYIYSRPQKKSRTEKI